MALPRSSRTICNAERDAGRYPGGQGRQVVEFRACFSVSDCASCSCADAPVPPGWLPSCYSTFQNLLPAPVVTLEENGVQSVFVAPDSVEFINLLGTDYTSFFDSIGFNWKRLAGAKVLKIEGQDPYAYAKHIAATKSGNYLDHGVRVNSVFSSYRISGTDYSQRFGDIAGPAFPDLETLTLTLIPVNSTKAETIKVPFLSDYLGEQFTDKESLCVCLSVYSNQTVDRSRPHWQLGGELRCNRWDEWCRLQELWRNGEDQCSEGAEAREGKHHSGCRPQERRGPAVAIPAVLADCEWQRGRHQVVYPPGQEDWCGKALVL